MTKSIRCRVYVAAVGIAAVLTLYGPGYARADETVSIGGSQAVLLRPAAPKASVILMPGGDGEIAVGPGGRIGRLGNNQVVRTRASYKARGLAVLVVNADVNVAAAVNYMRKIKSPVIVIATSRGTREG